MDFAFNEVSLDDIFYMGKPYNNGKEEFEKFVGLINLLKKQKLIQEFFFPDDFFERRITYNYTVRDWLSDKTVNSNHRQFLRTFMGKANYIDKSLLNGEFIFYYKDSELNGIGAAFSKEYSEIPVVISVVSEEFWESDYLHGKLLELTDDGNILELYCKLNNITYKTNIQNLKIEQKTRLFNNISSGQDAWENREKLFPNLVFCESVKKQLYEDSERYHIIKIMDRLQNLQNYFEIRHSVYNPRELGMNARTESDSVKKDNNLNRYRLFTLPSGEKKYFYDHISFTGKYSDGRIHFLPDVENMICYIGYIGRHLPTKKY